MSKDMFTHFKPCTNRFVYRFSPQKRMTLSSFVFSSFKVHCVHLFIFFVIWLIGNPASAQKLSFLPMPSHTSTHFPVVVRVFDIETQKPISGAVVAVQGLQRLYLTDAFGYVQLQVPKTSKASSISVRHPRYMATTQTQLNWSKRAPVELGMPHLKRLKQADLWVRDQAAQDPSRQQTLLPQLPRPHMPSITPKYSTLNSGVTYPMPKQIKVKKTDGSIITLALEEYLKGVLPREIGTSFPPEAMKAQAIAARTYTVQYTQGGKKAICTTTTCQVWSPKHYASTTAAVLATKGQVAVHKGKLAGGYFAASCGGSTINSEDKWSYRAFLRARPCIENKGTACSVVCSLSTCGKRRCPSSHATCWGVFGHRIGLCQRGAQSMAKCGKTYVEIIKHYYTGVEIANAATQPVDDAKLVRETIPPNTKLQTGAAFTKEWILENTGDTTWSSGAQYRLARLDGTAFGGPASINIPTQVQIKPKQSHTFSISLKVPSNSGVYTARWQMQKDGKGFGPILTIQILADLPAPSCIDADKDGFFVGGPHCSGPPDCDDTNKNIHPNAREICGNAIDEDCKDGAATCPSECKDEDKDGYFAAHAKCTGPYDCDDTDKNVHHNAREICGNNKDDDCRDGDRPCSGACVDADKDGYGVGADCPKPHDCDDTNKNIYPGAPEVCGNNKDDDCQKGDAPCTKPPQRKMKLGEFGCKSSGDCITLACAQYNGRTMCSQKCTASNPTCPADMTCLNHAACWPKKDVPTHPLECRTHTDCKSGFICNVGRCQERKKKGCGCTLQPTPQDSLSWMLLALFAFLLGVRKR